MLQVFTEFLHIGFRHILPDGIDHVLFVLGLFLICREFKPLLMQVTLFTLGHSFTMGLAMAELVRLPAKPVEVLIAFSIAFVAAENLMRKDLSKWRPWVVLASGLVHGLGFAHAFSGYSIPATQPVAALLGMSLGVEVGQLTVILTACLLLGWYWRAQWYRYAITLPGSLAMMACGLLWTVERLISD